jgi:hypothetical protein
MSYGDFIIFSQNDNEYTQYIEKQTKFQPKNKILKQNHIEKVTKSPKNIISLLLICSILPHTKNSDLHCFLVTILSMLFFSKMDCTYVMYIFIINYAFM